MIKAWRRTDGKYRLDFGDSYSVILTYPHNGGSLTYMGGEWDREQKQWIVPEMALGAFKGVEKMYGVVAGPSSCGCEPAGFRWVTESEVKAGKTLETRCPRCSLLWHQRAEIAYGRVLEQRETSARCDIIDVCGEADEAEAIYASEFAHKVGALT